MPQKPEDTKKSDCISENIPKKHSIVIKFFCRHSFVLYDNWSQMLRVVVPLWPVSSKVNAYGLVDRDEAILLF